MNGREILAHNHDLHMHTRHFSDGWHPVEEIIAFGLRWLEDEPWVGISEHSPLLEHVIRAAGDTHWQRTAREIRLVEKPVSPRIQNQIDRQVHDYLEIGREWQHQHRAKRQTSLLIGLEADWTAQGCLVGKETLSALDYVLMAYHGRAFSDPEQVKRFLFGVIRHPYCDILAHPDASLGPTGLEASAWRDLFQEMEQRGVLCEYNLTTPLRDEILDIALADSGVQFVIGSDIHDFRQKSTRRIMDAWSESKGGGFPEAYEYLRGFLQKSADDALKLVSLFDTPEKLTVLEEKVYRSRRRNQPEVIHFSEEESRLLEILDRVEDPRRDRSFLSGRLERFSGMDIGRLASVWPLERFLETLREGRRVRVGAG